MQILSFTKIEQNPKIFKINHRILPDIINYKYHYTNSNTFFAQNSFFLTIFAHIFNKHRKTWKTAKSYS